MKVVLRKDHDKLGEIGEIVEVAPGYARNFLVPGGIAFEATSKNIKLFEEEKKVKLARRKKGMESIEALSQKLSEGSFTVSVQVGEEDRLYGSVTSLDIAESLAVEGFEIDKRKIVLEEPIKSLGIYHVPVKLHPNVTVEIKVWVVKK